MITKEPYNKTQFLSDKLFTKSARNAFLHILRKLRAENRTLLLPAYIGMNDYEGSGVFDVVEISRIPYSFYEIDEKFAPMVDTIVLEDKKDYCLLLIHYFGFAPANFPEVLQFCANKNVLLIEDCAHTLEGRFQGKKLGTFGQYGFHSIHKVLPTDDGGILVDNSGKKQFQFSPEDEGIKNETIAIYALAQSDEISQKRIENYNLYLELLEKNSAYAIVFPKLKEGIIPLNFPILVNNGKRENMYFDLEREGVLTCALYYKLIPQISNGRYPGAHRLSESILNLPVHQDTESKDIEYICNTINKIVKSI